METIVIILVLLYLLTFILIPKIYINESVEPSLISIAFLIIPILNTIFLIKHIKKLKPGLKFSDIVKFYKYLD